MSTKRIDVENTYSRQRRRMLWLFAGVCLLGMSVMFLTTAQPTLQDNTFLSITVSGEPVSLVDYRGKIVMLNFWATWCPPCREEMPVIENAFEQFHDRGFVVLAVNNAERNDRVSAFVEQYQLTFPVVLDYAADIQQQFGINGYPTSIFLDEQGEIYAAHQGAINAAQLTQYIEDGLQRMSS